MLRIAFAAALIGAVAAMPTPAAAWWIEGHHVVARIAQNFIDPDIFKRVQAILATDTDLVIPKDFRGAADWLDQYWAEGHPEVATWHLNLTDIRQSGVDLKRDCADGDCMIPRIEAAEKQLRDPAVQGQDRVRALKYLLHFLGDLHQPLHIGHNRDEAGNYVEVLYYGQERSLHFLWDNEIIKRLDPRERRLAVRLSGDVTPDDIANWSKGNLLDWANESFDLAETVVYGQLPVGRPAIIDDKYNDAAVSAVELQLKRAGVRTAMVLNQLFADPARPQK